MNKQLRILRNELGLNQRDFAKKLKLGHSTLAMFETGQRIPKDIHISQICQTFNVNEAWLRTGEGEIFNKSDESILTNLSSEYNLNDSEKKIIATYLRLDEKKRKQLTDFIECFANEFMKNNNDEISATVAVRPTACDDNMTREEAHQMLDTQFDAKEKGAISLASTGGSGSGVKMA